MSHCNGGATGPYDQRDHDSRFNLTWCSVAGRSPENAPRSDDVVDIKGIDICTWDRREL